MAKYKVIIDADYIAYKLGFALEDIDRIGIIKKSVDEYLTYITDTLEKIFINIELPIIVISAPGKSNFRYELATIKPYKGNRVAPKPKHYDLIREILSKIEGSLCIEGQEADDTVADLAEQNPEKTVIVSADKDLRQVPGWHFEPSEKRPVYFVDRDVVGMLMLEKTTGDKTQVFGIGMLWHLAQALLGDTADNIPGIKGIGHKKVYDLFKAKDFKYTHCVTLVQDLYIKQYGGIDEGMKAYDEVRTLLQMGGHNENSRK